MSIPKIFKCVCSLKTSPCHPNPRPVTNRHGPSYTSHTLYKACDQCRSYPCNFHASWLFLYRESAGRFLTTDQAFYRTKIIERKSQGKQNLIERYFWPYVTVSHRHFSFTFFFRIGLVSPRAHG